MKNPGPIMLRPGHAGDLARVYAIEQASFSDPWLPVSLRAELQPDPLRLCLVAERDATLLGYLMSWHMGERLHLLNLAVEASVRRTGLGTRLLRAAAVTAARNKMVEMTLEVRRSNAAARGFYRRLGFAEVGLRAGYYPNNGEDAVLLSCLVASLLAAADSDARRAPE